MPLAAHGSRVSGKGCGAEGTVSHAADFHFMFPYMWTWKMVSWQMKVHLDTISKAFESCVMSLQCGHV
jgi:hypothetical protein